MNLFPFLKRKNAPGTGGTFFASSFGHNHDLGRRLRLETLEDRRLLAVDTAGAVYLDNAAFADSVSLQSSALVQSGAASSTLVLSVTDVDPIDPGTSCTLTVKYHVENAGNASLNDFSLRIYFDSTYIQGVIRTDSYATEHGFTTLDTSANQLPNIYASYANSPKQPISSILRFDTSGDFDQRVNYYVECRWFLIDNDCLPLTTTDRTLVELTFTVQDTDNITNAASIPFYFTGDIITPQASWSAPAKKSTTISIIGKLPTPDQPSITKSERCDQVTVTWKTVEGAIGYKLEYWRSGNSTHPTTAGDSLDTSVTVTDLKPNTLYYFRVTAKSVYGDAYNSTSQNSFRTDTVLYNLCAKTAGSLSAESVGSDDTFTINNFVVENLGNYNSGDFTVAFYASTDDQITATDTLLGTLDTTSFVFGGSATLSSGALSAESLTPGTVHYIGWIINKTGDSDLSNNTARLDQQLYKKIALTGVTISGTAQVGKTLTATVSPQGATASYQWYRGETAITNATGSSYKLQIHDADHTIHVTATGSGDYSGEVTSDSTALVTRPDYCFSQDVYNTSPYGDIYITVREPDPELTYLFDLDGDGNYEKTVERGFETLGFYVSVSDRLAADVYTMWVRTLDSQNNVSPSVDAQVRVVFSPTLTVSRSAHQNGQILMLNLGITSSRAIMSWSIDWGDDSPQRYDQIANQLSVIHYYGTAQNQTDVRVTVTDAYGETYSFVATRHSVTIPTLLNGQEFSLTEHNAESVDPIATRTDRIETTETAAVFTQLTLGVNQEPLVRSNMVNRNEKYSPSDNAGEISANALDTVFDDLSVTFWEQEMFVTDSLATPDGFQSFWDDRENETSDTKEPSGLIDSLIAAFDVWR